MSSAVPTDLPSAAELAEFTLGAQHPVTRAWTGRDERLRRLAVAHEFDLRLAGDAELSAQRAELLDVGQSPEAFLNRWVPVAGDLAAMLSIRFEGMDPTKPFVDATVLTRPVAGGDLHRLGELAVERYGGFAPRYLRVWSAEPVDAFPDTGRDRRFLAAPLRDLVGRPGLPAELTLGAAADLAHYADARAAYDRVDREHQAHRDQARLQPEDDLQESLERGTLFDVLVDGEWAGYVGATEDGTSTLGLRGYVVQELILGARGRGRGYGSWLTTLLARALPDRDGVLVGTIHADNRGAIAAALSAGRRDVGGWFQVPLDAWNG